MFTPEYILLCIAEEACEIATEATLLQEKVTDAVAWSKFVETVETNPDLTKKLVLEINDFVACLELLMSFKFFAVKFHTLNVIELKLKQLGEEANDFLTPLILSCLQVQKSVSKMLRFGIETENPNTNEKEIVKLRDCINSVIASVEFCKINKIPMPNLYNQNDLTDKKIKIQHYFDLAANDKIILKG